MSIEPKLKDALLMEFMARETDPAVIVAALRSLGAAQICRALEEPRVTAYLRDVPADIAGLARRTLAPLADGEIEVSRLAALHIYAGASAGAVPDFHYVVRTDIAPGGETELERWYDEEHMPALAAVPGVVLAQRLVSLDAGPRYYACYDLVSPDILQTPAWLAVRGTAWSGRVRPTFRNTRRIVSRRLDGALP